MVEWTDRTLLLHFLSLMTLAGMIFHSAYEKHQNQVWRKWPPVLLVVWGVSEFLDALIYFRRWLSVEFDITYVRYDGPLSFAVNILSLIAITALIYRIVRGDVEE